MNTSLALPTTSPLPVLRRARLAMLVSVCLLASHMLGRASLKFGLIQLPGDGVPLMAQHVVLIAWGSVALAALAIFTVVAGYTLRLIRRRG